MVFAEDGERVDTAEDIAAGSAVDIAVDIAEGNSLASPIRVDFSCKRF